MKYADIKTCEYTLILYINLTRNGRGEYAIVKIGELDRLRASVALMAQLEDGEKSAREGGWISADDVEAALGL